MKTMNLKSGKQECILYSSNDHYMQKFDKCNAYTEVYKMENMK